MDKTIIVEDCLKAALLVEGPAVAATRMLGLVLTIVRKLLEGSDARQVAAVPEPMVRDVVNYAAFVITSGAPDLFAASKDLHASMSVRNPSYHLTSPPPLVMTPGSTGVVATRKHHRQWHGWLQRMNRPAVACACRR